MQTVLTVLHVAAAVFIVGPMAIVPMTGLRALRSGDAVQARTSARSTALFSWLSLIVFILGFGVMGIAPEEWGFTMATPWILWSVILYLIGFLLSVIVVVPHMRKAVAAVSAADTPAKPAGYGMIAGSSGLVSLLLLAVVVLMVWRPGVA